MTERNDGGPAFPSQFQNFRGDWARDAGMTVRQYYAAKAMQGLLASWGQHDVTDFDELASDALNIADAMLKAEEK